MSENAPATAIGISLQVALDQSRQLVLQTHVPLDAESGVLNGVLDKIASAADRQEARYIIAHKQKLLNQAKQNLVDTMEHQARTYAAAKSAWEEGGREDGFKLEGAAANDYNNGEKTANHLRREIEIIENDIARLEGLLS